MQIQNAIITGSFSYNGADLSNVTSSNAYSASLSSRTTDLESTSSVLVGASASFSSILSSVSSSQQQLSSSFLTLTASFNAVSASQQQVSASYIALSASYNTFSGSASTRITVDSASLLQVSASYTALSGSYNTFSGSASTRITQIENVYATTGSNSFRETQSITGSLTVTGQIIAQTLNVQQVTSSIIYSSGSNNFGCDLNSRQTFTGSVNITGSQTVFGNVGIGISSPSTLLHMVGTSATLTIADNTSYACGVGGKLSLQGNYRSVGDITEGGYVKVNKSNSTNGDYAFDMIFATSNYTAGIAERLRITSTGVACFGGNVCAPSFVLANGNCITALRNTAGAAIGVLGFTSGSDTLFIKGGTSGAAASIQFQDTGGTMATFYNCKLGIGTTTPGTALEVVSRAADADRTIPHNVLTLTAEQGNAPYGFFGGAILFKNRSYTSGLVESARIRSVIYDDGAPANCGGGIWFETTPTPGGTLTPSLVINYQGRVGIGTSSPCSTFDVVVGASGERRLLVNYDNSVITVKAASNTTAPEVLRLIGDNIRFNIGTTGSGTEAMRITACGNILINQTCALTGVPTSVEMSGVGSGTPTLQASYNVFSYHGAANTTWRGYYVFHKSRGTTIGSVTAVAADDYLGTIRWNGADGTGQIIAAEINAMVDGTVGTDDMPTRLTFSTTADGSSSPTERLRITNSGQVRVIGVGKSLAFDTDGSGASTTLATEGQYDFRIYNGRGGASNIDVSTYEIGFGMNGSTNRYRMGCSSFYPSGDNAYTLGYSGQRWSAVWSANGTIQTSDARQKKDIETSNLGLEFINKLRPVSYKWKVGKNVVTSDGERIDENGAKHSNDIITPVSGTRTHYGLIAQEVKEALGNNDFGGYVYDENTDTMALRYDQFIAPLIKAIQEQQCTINTLKTCLGIA